MKKAMLVVFGMQLLLAIAFPGLIVASPCVSFWETSDENGNLVRYEATGNYGCPIGVSYNNVQAHSNGPSGHWTGTGGGDLKYQCVQLAKDYFRQNYDIDINTVVYAKNIFTGRYQDKYGKWHEVTTEGGKIYRYENGSTLPPKDGDLIVYGGTTYGHVGILKDIKVKWNADGTGNGTAQVFEQNISPTNPFRDITFTVDKDGGYHLPDYGVLKVLGWVSPNSPAEKAKLSKRALLAKCSTGFRPSNGYQLDPTAVLVLGDSGWHPFKRYEALSAYLARTWRSEDEIQHLTQAEMSVKNSKSVWMLDISDFIAPGVAVKYLDGYKGHESSAVFYFDNDRKWHALYNLEAMQELGLKDSDIIFPAKRVLDYYPMGETYNAQACRFLPVPNMPDGLGGGGSSSPLSPPQNLRISE